MKTVVIHQPDFLPHIAFFHRLIYADIYIILDHVPISKRGWAHRDQIKTAKGKEWITVPIIKIGEQPRINEAIIDSNNKHIKKIINLIEANYRGAPYFDLLFAPLKEIYLRKHQKLIHLNLELLEFLFDCFDVKIATCLSSDFGVTSTKSQMNADLVKKVGGDTYLSGVGAVDYHDNDPFTQMGIQVVWQKFQPPIYSQLFGDFIPYLSSIDLLFNCGIEKSREILRSC